MTTVTESKSEMEYLQKVNKAMIQLRKNTITAAARKTNKPKSKTIPWNKGRSWPEETKQKISHGLKAFHKHNPGAISWNRGISSSDEIKDRIRRRMLEYCITHPEAIMKMSLNRKSWWNKPANRKKMLDIMQSLEHRRKVSEHRKAYCKDKENRERVIMQRQDYRKRLSVSMMAMWADPEKRERILTFRNSPESKLKQSESMKLFYRKYPEEKIRAIKQLMLFRNNRLGKRYEPGKETATEIMCKYHEFIY